MLAGALRPNPGWLGGTIGGALTLLTAIGFVLEYYRGDKAERAHRH